MFRSFKIFIDDVDHGQIKNNETKEFELDNGVHTIYVQMGFFASRKSSVTIDNSIITIQAALPPLIAHSNIPILRGISEEPLSVETNEE